MENTETSPARLKINHAQYRLYQASEAAASVAPADTGNTIPAETMESAQAQIDDQSAAMVYRLAKARRRVDYYAALAGTVGVLPMPVLDMLTVGGLQLKLIHDLSRIYGTPFSGQRAKAAIAALIGGVQTGLIIKSLFKYIPVYGYAVMAMPSAFAASALTYAIGRVFIHHFELGGTLLNFDADKLRSYFREQLRRKNRNTK
jgi:uncharacterized protein (DUF697 family)